MKSSFYLLCLAMLLIVSSSFAFQILPDYFKNHELKQNEIINFKDGPELNIETYSGSFKKGAYDLSRYTIILDNAGNLKVSELRGCAGKHQNDIDFYLCNGTVTRKGDTLKINAKTIYSKFYIFSITKNGIVDSLSSSVKISLISKTLKNKYCPTLINMISNLNLVALPKNVNKKEIYKPMHKDNTIGIFTYFSLKDSEGTVKNYSEGDYVLIGGNSLSISK